MDSLGVNKAVGAVLVAGIAFFATGLLGDELVHVSVPAKTAIQIDVAPAAPAGGAPAPAEDQPIAVFLASADPAEGQKLTQQQGCVACHSFNEGGKAGVGPNLYGVVGGPHGHMEGYAYSTALKGKAGPWTYDELNEWLKKPAAYAPGTKMSYAGLADEKKRADIIDYLHTLAHDPLPLPAAPAQTASTNGAGGGAGGVSNGGTAGGPQGGAEGAQSVEALLASADPAAGQKDTMKLGCVACHSFNEGGKAGIGPNLYGVVGAPHGHMEGYSYSSALKSHEGPWTYAELDKWLTKPSAYAPGTKMSFAGIPDPKTRAEVIDYLRTLAASPEPLPTVESGPKPAEEPVKG
jgi:cytochrome c